MISGQTIFISPLDWGFGHATRCVPLIKQLSENNTVIIGVTELNRNFFALHFPSLQKTNLPSYTISYSSWLPAWLKIFIQSPKIKAVIREEKKVLAKIISQYNINLIISDNRFGLYHKSIESIFITHQLNIKSPFIFGFANSINRKYIHRFSKIWIPDYENKTLRLSGQLSDSEGITIPVEYIGPQSALINDGKEIFPEHKSDLLILLSGVEPQRTILEKKLLKKFENSSHKIILIRGSNSEFSCTNKSITVINFAFENELKQWITGTEKIICRSGYSTLMDLHLLEKKDLILIPTPGQTEQEYLADYWKEKFGALKVPQNKINFTTL